MYPQFETEAKKEGYTNILSEFQNQIIESTEHAEEFKKILVKAENRFAALKKVEERHANAYKQVLGEL